MFLYHFAIPLILDASPNLSGYFPARMHQLGSHGRKVKTTLLEFIFLTSARRRPLPPRRCPFIRGMNCVYTAVLETLFARGKYAKKKVPYSNSLLYYPVNPAVSPRGGGGSFFRLQASPPGGKSCLEGGYFFLQHYPGGKFLAGGISNLENESSVSREYPLAPLTLRRRNSGSAGPTSIISESSKTRNVELADERWHATFLDTVPTYG